MPEYTIDELAQKAGSNVRNVRAYQAKKLLPKPQKIGRANVYSEVHLQRLKLVQRLLDQGFSLRHIAEMTQAMEQGQSVSALVGLESALTKPLSEEVKLFITRDQLAQDFGPNLQKTVIDQATYLGLIMPKDDGYEVPSPAIYNVGAELVKQGIPLPIILVQLGQLRSDVERIAERFVDLVATQLIDPYNDKLPSTDEMHRLTAFVQRVRPMAQIVVDIELRKAIDTNIHREIGHRLSRMMAAQRRESES